ncbi:MAG: alpha-D-ribose 1-methylphosphonate 5-triphosphate diphosphatase, partial [Solirubrobacteraceae bacterium]
MDHSPGQGQFTSEQAWRAWYARRFQGDEAALDDLIARRRARQSGVDGRRCELAALARASAATLASHDDDTIADIERSAELGSSIAEFPVSVRAAAAASAAGLGVVMGAPNAQRGRSHMDGLSARQALSDGHLDALASDYHPGSLIAAAYQLAAEDVCSWSDAVALVSSGPAAIAGLSDRGLIVP